MRILPFMKRKNGIQFAGVGLDTGGGGGGGGGSDTWSKIIGNFQLGSSSVWGLVTSQINSQTVDRFYIIAKMIDPDTSTIIKYSGNTVTESISMNFSLNSDGLYVYGRSGVGTLPVTVDIYYKEV